MANKSEVEIVLEVKERLSGRFAGVSMEQISARVDGVYREFADSVVRDFIPLLVERRVDRELSVQSGACAAAV